jgi:hypothetical protein
MLEDDAHSLTELTPALHMQIDFFFNLMYLLKRRNSQLIKTSLEEQ